MGDRDQVFIGDFPHIIQAIKAYIILTNLTGIIFAYAPGRQREMT